MDNVAVFVEDQRRPGLLGLYEGVPLTKRAAYGYGLQRPADARPDHDLPAARSAGCAPTKPKSSSQVRVTVVHEVAHHFGIGDRRLEELGWG